MQQDQLGPLRRHARLTRACERLPASRRAFRASQQQQCVGLANAQVAPTTRRGISHIHHEVVGAFDLVKPVAGVGFGAHAPDQLGAPETAQRLDEVTGEAADIDFDALRAAA